MKLSKSWYVRLDGRHVQQHCLDVLLPWSFMLLYMPEASLSFPSPGVLSVNYETMCTIHMTYDTALPTLRLNHGVAATRTLRTDRHGSCKSVPCGTRCSQVQAYIRPRGKGGLIFGNISIRRLMGEEPDSSCSPKPPQTSCD